LAALDARIAGFVQLLYELSIVFAIEVVAGEPAIFYQRLDAEAADRGVIFGVVTKL
jgi:hypothetical protein